MVPTGRPTLGIDVVGDEIRVAEVSGKWPEAQSVRAAMARIPAGSLQNGRVTDPELFASALRSAVCQLGSAARDAVLGIPDRAVTARMLEVPPMPDSELRTVVQGELEHYQIVRAGGGSFDCMRLAGGDGADNRRALVMAAEQMVATGYEQAVAKAGLRLVALEPASLGLLRLGLTQIPHDASAICLGVSLGRCEIAFVHGASIRLYRRFELGSDELIRSGRYRESQRVGDGQAVVMDRIMLASDPEVHDEPSSGEAESEQAYEARVSSAAGSLAIELQRSLEYYRREFPQAEIITRAYLMTNDPEAAPLAQWLAEALHLEIILAALPPALTSSRPGLELPAGLAYSAAVGLAMREMPGIPAQAPRFDLSVMEKPEPELVFARSKLALSLAACVAFVLVGTGIAYWLGRQANDVEHGLQHRKDYLASIQRTATERAAEVAQRTALLRALTAGNMPTPAIVDEVAAAVDPHVGLTEFSLDRAGKVAMAGEASDERGLIRTLEDLKRLPVLASSSLDSYDASAAQRGTAAEAAKFQISAQVAGLAQKAPAAAGGVTQ